MSPPPRCIAARGRPRTNRSAGGSLLKSFAAYGAVSLVLLGVAAQDSPCTAFDPATDWKLFQASLTSRTRSTWITNICTAGRAGTKRSGLVTSDLPASERDLEDIRGRDPARAAGQSNSGGPARRRGSRPSARCPASNQRNALTRSSAKTRIFSTSSAEATCSKPFATKKA